jgi:phosphoglycolate phosphatase-like HAD superfamily hydrolase
MSAVRRLGGAIFDCDGVLLDSNRIKAEGFRIALEGEPPGAVDRFFDYFHANNGLMRDALFEHYYRSIAPRADWATCAVEATRVFGERTLRSLLSCAQISGVVQLLEALSAAGVPCAVVSAARPSDLEVILKEQCISRFFAAIRGGDGTKVAQVASLLEEGIVDKPLIYFGDSRVDMDTAESFDCLFVFVSAGTEWLDGEAVCRDRGHAVVSDFRGFDLERTVVTRLTS